MVQAAPPSASSLLRPLALLQLRRGGEDRQEGMFGYPNIRHGMRMEDSRQNGEDIIIMSMINVLRQ